MPTEQHSRLEPAQEHSRLSPNAEKVGAVAEIAEQFSSSSAALITEYRGLSVKQITDLRRALGRDTTYAVVKNTLTKRAAADAGVAVDESLFAGPTAIAFVKGDPVQAAKGLRDFARTNPLLVIKGGVFDGKALSAEEIRKIADLESREALLAKLAGALKALPTRAAGLFQAPLAQMARLAKALEEKKPAGDAPAAAAEEPVITAEESVITAEESVITAEEPAVTADEPAAAAEEPAAVAAEADADAESAAPDAAPETPAEPAE
jgi:large subunit ribosomal protein L10